MGSYTVGLDLGQTDFTALAVVERVLTPPGNLTVDAWERMRLDGRPGIGRPVEEHHVRHLARWPMGTPYPEVVEQVGSLMRRPPLATDALLVIDRTGVGVAVMDMLHRGVARRTHGRDHPPGGRHHHRGRPRHGLQRPQERPEGRGAGHASGGHAAHRSRAAGAGAATGALAVPPDDQRSGPHHLRRTPPRGRGPRRPRHGRWRWPWSGQTRCAGPP